MVIAYLLAVVAANLAVARFGPVAAIPIAFVLVSLDLTTRDQLHDRWKGRNLPARMAILIAVGGLLSYVLNAAVARIAIGSTVAFAVSATVDALVYHALRHRPAWQRVNASNIVAALCDSVLFVTIAFGSFLPLIVAAQTLAKVAGGAVWMAVIYRRSR